MVMFAFGSTVKSFSKVSSKTRSFSEPQPASDNANMVTIGRILSLLLRSDRTHKFYQHVQVIDQGKSCRDGDNCKKRGFTSEIAASFIFEVIAGDVPKWSWP